MKVDESNFETLDRASKITLTNYNIKWFDAENIDGYIDPDNVITMIDDLIYEIDYLKEKIEDIKQDMRDNYRPIPYSEMVGISDRDFI